MTRAKMAGWWAPRFWTTLFIVIILGLSALVLSQTMLFKELAALMSSGRGIDPDMIAALLLLPILVLFALIAAASRKGAKAALGVSWVMLAPAILSLSDLDWLTVFSPSGSGGHLAVALPSYAIIAITIGLAAACLCQRSYSQLASLRDKMISRGIDAGEIDVATSKMFVSMSALALGATMASIAVFAGGSLLAGLERPSAEALALGLAVVVVAVAVLLVSLRGLEKARSPSSGR